MDISPASSSASALGIEPFIDDPFASSDPDAEVPTSNARLPEPQDRLADDMRSSVAGLESRFAAFTQLLRRELTTLENRCAAALRSLFLPSSAQPAQKAAPPSRYSNIIQTAAQRNHLDPALLDAVIGQESGFRADVVSGAGAVGLMQLMPATARELGVSDPFDPAQNVEGGAKYLRSLLDRYDGRLDLALAAYNAGPGAVDRFGGVPPYRETQEYVSSVMAGYRSALLRAG